MIILSSISFSYSLMPKLLYSNKYFNIQLEKSFFKLRFLLGKSYSLTEIGTQKYEYKALETLKESEKKVS